MGKAAGGEEIDETGRRRGDVGAFVPEATEVIERGAGDREPANRGETTGVEEIGVEEMVSGVGEIKAAVWKGVGAWSADTTLADITEEDREIEGVGPEGGDGSEASEASVGQNGGMGRAA